MNTWGVNVEISSNVCPFQLIFLWNKWFKQDLWLYYDWLCKHLHINQDTVDLLSMPINANQCEIRFLLGSDQMKLTVSVHWIVDLWSYILPNSTQCASTGIKIQTDFIGSNGTEYLSHRALILLSCWMASSNSGNHSGPVFPKVLHCVPDIGPAHFHFGLTESQFAGPGDLWPAALLACRAQGAFTRKVYTGARMALRRTLPYTCGTIFVKPYPYWHNIRAHIQTSLAQIHKKQNI